MVNTTSALKFFPVTRLFLMDCSLPGSSVHGIFQARVLEWVAIAFSIKSCYEFTKRFKVYSARTPQGSENGTLGLSSQCIYVGVTEWALMPQPQ